MAKDISQWSAIAA